MRRAFSSGRTFFALNKVVVSNAALATLSTKKPKVKRSHGVQIRSSNRAPKESVSAKPTTNALGPITVREEKKKRE
jgi:hypothetical protein